MCGPILTYPSMGNGGQLPSPHAQTLITCRYSVVTGAMAGRSTCWAICPIVPSLSEREAPQDWQWEACTMTMQSGWGLRSRWWPLCPCWPPAFLPLFFRWLRVRWIRSFDDGIELFVLSLGTGCFNASTSFFSSAMVWFWSMMIWISSSFVYWTYWAVSSIPQSLSYLPSFLNLPREQSRWV